MTSKLKKSFSSRWLSRQLEKTRKDKMSEFCKNFEVSLSTYYRWTIGERNIEKKDKVRRFLEDKGPDWFTFVYQTYPTVASIVDALNQRRENQLKSINTFEAECPGFSNAYYNRKKCLSENLIMRLIDKLTEPVGDIELIMAGENVMEFCESIRKQRGHSKAKVESWVPSYSELSSNLLISTKRKIAHYIVEGELSWKW